MTELAVRFEGVGKDYSHFSLRDIDLELPQGSITGLIGANGAGKSTTIRILMGLVRQDRGTVQVLGLPMPAQQIAVKQEVGFVSEDMSLYKAATLGWHLELMGSIYPRWDQAYAEELARRFELCLDQKVRGLSHGQRTKAALVLAFARRPRLLVLDEPTSGLDPIARHEVLSALMEALTDDRRTILFSSQNTHDVEQISDQITFLDRGRIIDRGDKETFLDRWRRLRLEVPHGQQLPPLEGTVNRKTSGRLTVVTTRNHGPSTLAAYQSAGIVVHAVENMSLEEIFVATVRSRRKELAA